MNNDFVSALHRIAAKKRFFAWLTFGGLAVASMLARIFPGQSPQIVYWSALASAGTLLTVVMETHKAVTAARTTSYPSLSKAWNAMEADLLDALSGSRAQVTWLGVTLSDAWPHLHDV